MKQTASIGWRKLVEGYPAILKRGKLDIPAYSEFMPPPQLGITPYGDIDTLLFSKDDPFGWRIPEIEEQLEIQPGLANLSHQIFNEIVELGQGQSAARIAGHQRRNLHNNPYWPPELSSMAGKLTHEQYLSFLPLVLSKTQDDKGRLRWTFFGSSEQGPEKAFWNSFYRSPGEEKASQEAIDFLCYLFLTVYQEHCASASDLFQVGLRVLPTQNYEHFSYWKSDPLPSWTHPFIWDENQDLSGVRFMITFRPFSRLPPLLREKYLAGQIRLLPFPGSLVFWGMPGYVNLQKELSLAMQLPLQRLVARHSGLGGIKVPQSGWFHEPGSNKKAVEVAENLLLNTYRRSHRWDRVERYEDEVINSVVEDSIGRTLFSTDLDVLKLYNKPLARNCQIWTEDSHLLLDGPHANHDILEKASLKVSAGGSFRYRFQFPAMRVARHEIYWHRPLIAFWQRDGGAGIISNQLYGYFTGYPSDNPDPAGPVNLWPRLLDRKPYHWALHNFSHLNEHYQHQTTFNIVRLLDLFHKCGNKPVPRDMARKLLCIPEEQTLDSWLASLAERAINPNEGKLLRQEIDRILEPVPQSGTCSGLFKDTPPALVQSVKTLTFDYSATRSFEEAWWRDIAVLSHGKFVNKNSADCVQDSATRALLKHRHRDLEALGQYLLKRHHEAIIASGMENQAVCGEFKFQWKTDFNFSDFGGWKNDQEGHSCERDLIVIVPGKNHHEAVILADHYDTAYMEDLYSRDRGGTGARIAAPGADDNHSATSALLQATPIFLKLSQQGLLARDIWLIHLTGEEFPSDCLGARNLAAALIKQKISLHSVNGQKIDLMGTQIMGIFIMDMIGHNTRLARDIFQICPGKDSQSIQLARQALLASYLWNAGTRKWNSAPERQGRGRSHNHSTKVPPLAEHLQIHGELRLSEDPKSSLYNTDGQIFSDCGLPVVLLMENYDIKRSGYHDTQDTLKNIDLDYGCALASIAIETVARVAHLKNLNFAVCNSVEPRSI